MRRSEWDKDPFEMERGKLPGFVDYLAEVWQNRVRYEAEVQTEQQESRNRQCFFDVTFDGKLYARNYVGVVQYEGMRMEVYPKILRGRALDKWQLNLFYWLSYCQRIKFPFSLASLSEMPLDDFLEVLIYLFANYTHEVLSQQSFQAYQEVGEENPFLKGRLLFDDYIKHNLITGHWERFYCEYEPFVYDNLFNRIVKYVAKRLMAISTNGGNVRRLEEILILLDEVSDVRCVAQDCDKVRLNPLYKEHGDILRLCRMFLSNQVIDVDDEDSRNFCFLIPMEYVFEDFIAGFILDKWPELKAEVQSERHLTVGKEFWMRNDVYIPGRLVIDTKYKVRDLSEGKRMGVEQGDLYQMISYAVGRGCKEVMLLYPEGEGNSVIFRVNSELMEACVKILVREVDITFEDVGMADGLIESRIWKLISSF